VSNLQQIAKAREFALAKHQGQTYGDKPYDYHLNSVANVCAVIWGYEEYIITAWLHDVIEDTDTDWNELKEEFGEEIANNVLALTNKENKAKTFHGISLFEVATRVKLADRLCNMTETLAKKDKRLAQKYVLEYHVFRDYLWSPDNCDFFQKKLDPIYEELKALLEVA
jgi:(p)ppGpp synthase/HD superfamily hydrolase